MMLYKTVVQDITVQDEEEFAQAKKNGFREHAGLLDRGAPAASETPPTSEAKEVTPPFGSKARSK
jgi:hypothetical protein